MDDNVVQFPANRVVRQPDEADSRPARFLRALRDTGDPAKSAETAGYGKEELDRLMKHDEKFVRTCRECVAEFQEERILAELGKTIAMLEKHNEAVKTLARNHAKLAVQVVRGGLGASPSI